MKIYLAASFVNQKRLRQCKDALWQRGHYVLATWLDEQIKPEGMTEEQFERKMAIKDMQEVAACDCFILDLCDPTKTMGKMVELGFAIAHHKLIYTVGNPAPHSIFLSYADHHFDTWEDVYKFFEHNHLVNDEDRVLNSLGPTYVS